MTAPMRVLVVDDEPHIRRAVAEIVESNGDATVTAGSVAEALQVLESQRIDLVLTDVVMPVASGLVLAQRVRDEFPGVRIMFMSGEVGPDVVDGFDAVTLMRKPFGASQLIDAINACRGGTK